MRRGLWLLPRVVASFMMPVRPQLQPIVNRRAAISSVPDAVGADEAHQLLKDVFGFPDYREGQREIISLLLDGASCAAVFPTGLGKSLCYQLPALVLDRKGLGLTLVVSPLVALMKDQVDALTKKGVACARLDGTLEAAEVDETLRKARGGYLHLLYVSPERFNNERFLQTLAKTDVALFVVDEAHCISEWGHNFRPDYLRLSEFAVDARAPIRLALTATATPQVAADMAERLAIPKENIIRTRSRRPNLQLLSVRAPDDLSERARFLARRLRIPERPKRPTIAYVTLQKTAVEVANILVEEGFDARPYHAGMADEDRAAVQDWFMAANDGNSVVCCTIAFGMGVDKSNVGGVYHFNLPKSLEEYSQGVGRAGRDNRLAVCEAFVSPADVAPLKALIYGDTPSPNAVLGLLEAVFGDVAQSAEGGEAAETDLSFYDLSQKLDVKDVVLKTLVAKLQMRGMVRELTSYFTTQQVALAQPSAEEARTEVLANLGDDESSLAMALLNAVASELEGRPRNTKWAVIDVKAFAEKHRVPKLRIPRELQRLSASGAVNLGAARKIRSRFQVLETFGGDIERRSTAIAALAQELSEQTTVLEQRELQRLDKVLSTLCDSSNISDILARYFGDTDAVTGSGVSHSRESGDPALGSLLPLPEPSEAELEAHWLRVRDVLEPAGPVPTDDAWLMARFAVGVKSPRITRLKLGGSSAFGCCAGHAFPRVFSKAREVFAAHTEEEE